MPLHRKLRDVRVLRRIFSAVDNVDVLSDILSQARPNAPLEERLQWLERLWIWIRKDETGGDPYIRLRYLFELLDKSPEWRELVSETLRSILRESSFLRLFLQTGYALESGIFHEIYRRILERILPQPPSLDAFEAFAPTAREEDEAWIEAIPVDLVAKIQGLVEKSGRTNPWFRIRFSALEALAVFTSGIVHHGLSDEIFRRAATVAGKQQSLFSSPFFALQARIQTLKTALVDSPQGTPDTSELCASVTADVLACRQAIQRVYDTIESSGVSVELVHRLEILNASLNRIELLLSLLLSGAEPLQRARELFARSIGACVARRSIRGYLSKHSYLLSRKIAERNGASGEHYVGHSLSERRKIFFSAIGAGFIVVFMAVCKLVLQQQPLPPLLQAIAIWFVYSLGFLAMQFTGTTLATKLPSFTASYIAHQLRHLKDRAHDWNFGPELRAILSSQAVALAGNVIGLLPVVFAVHWVFTSVFGTGLIEQNDAKWLLKSLDPIMSLTLFYGALTGVQLWLSSLAGGAFENWLVYHRVPEGIARHPRLRAVLGLEATEQLAQWLSKHASGVATNVALGFLFGFVPFIGAILHLDLDGKHVTISTSQAVFAMLSLETTPDQPVLIAASIAGLVFVGLMNLLVSFSLALMVAARACQISRDDLVEHFGFRRKSG